MIKRTFVAFLIFGTPLASANTTASLLGCTDCFNFVAPSVIGAENISPAEVGLIVYDTNTDTFRGYTMSGTWESLSDGIPMPSVQFKSASYTLTDADDTIVASTASGGITLSLPDASTVTGKVYHLVFSSSANTTTIDPYSSQTICGQATIKVPGTDAIDIQSDGSNWIGLGDSCTLRWYMTGNMAGNCTSGNSTFSGPVAISSWNSSAGSQRCEMTTKTGVCSATAICVPNSNQDGAGACSTYGMSSSSINIRGPGTSVAWAASCSCSR